MAVIKSKISNKSANFKEKASEYRKLISKLESLLQLSQRPENEAALTKLDKQNKLPLFERIERLIDPGTTVLNIAPLAGLEVYDGVPPGAGVQTLIAEVSGSKVMIIANNPTIKGGCYFPLSVKKHLRAQQIAEENKLPCIHLVDSGGAFLPLQSDVFPDRFHFGRIFYNQARMSQKGIPQVSLVLGSSTAGGAYVPAMSDETIMVENNAKVFLGGPPLVKAATGEIVESEELGGARVHSEISGLSDHLVENELEGIEKLRQIAQLFKQKAVTRILPTAEPEEPLYDASEIYGILGCDLKKPSPALEIIARLVDGSRFEEFKAEYGKTIKCGFAHIKGFLVAIIANDGALFSESALKATHFIQIADKRKIPLLFLQNISGFMVGKKYEHQGIAKHGAKMVTAVSTCSVPKLTLTIGGSFGAGNYGMAGRAYDPRYLFTWPGSEISVMGGAQAAKVLTQVSKLKKKEELEKLYSKTLEKFQKEANAFYATSKLWDDGIIDPLITRNILASCLSSCEFDTEKPEKPYGIFRM